MKGTSYSFVFLGFKTLETILTWPTLQRISRPGGKMDYGPDIKMGFLALLGL